MMIILGGLRVIRGLIVLFIILVLINFLIRIYHVTGLLDTVHLNWIILADLLHDLDLMQM